MKENTELVLIVDGSHEKGMIDLKGCLVSQHSRLQCCRNRAAQTRTRKRDLIVAG
jgi:hypothetical protein